MPRGGVEKPIGYETIWKDREGRIRTKIKTHEGMIDKRIYIWLKNNPNDNLNGYCIIHLDKNTTNFNINNLAKVKKGVFLLMLNNHIYFDKPELNKTSILIAQNMYEIKQKERGINERDNKRRSKSTKDRN